ncbi:hypothetical protein [Candidatus Frankia alpina]|uniref:hypothetical protein n=1 Tax=Candidatus Frankia alpina TaxID=2699483 RepID=UPI0013D21AF3|nr:hypothetical protein [Candidatus Frankia alpina]
MVGDPSVIGHVGALIVGTRGDAGPGEVVVRVRGGTETFLALSDTPLPKGASVLVIGTRGPRTVEVVPWLDPAALFGGDL